MRWIALAMLIGCGGTQALTPDAGPAAVSLDGCWKFSSGPASGQMQIAGSTGTFTQMGAVPDHGQLLYSDEANGTLVLLFYCQTAECGVDLSDGGTGPKDLRPDAGAPDTRFLFSVEGADTTHLTAPFSMTRC